MLSSFIDGTAKSGTAAPTFSALATEETLVVAPRNGNEQAFEILVERYRHRMVVVALPVLREVKTDTKGGPYVDHSIDRCIRGPAISRRHRHR
jgi:hypothetical protein